MPSQRETQNDNARSGGRLSYRFLEHVTDALVEVNAKSLKEAFSAAADAAINLTLDQNAVEERQKTEFSLEAKDLDYLLFFWLEEIVFILITRGFAIRRLDFDIAGDGPYSIHAKAYGEPLDLKRHNFKVEIKAPTFHEMQISCSDTVRMRFLLDL